MIENEFVGEGRKNWMMKLKETGMDMNAHKMTLDEAQGKQFYLLFL